MSVPSLETLDLNLLRVFHVLMEERSVSRAARRLHLTQPATSNALARLRTALDDALLVRRGNSMVPTRLALDLVPHFAAALRRIEHGLREASEFEPARLETSLTVGIDRYCQTLFGARLCARLRRAAPRLHVSLVDAPPHRCEDDLRAGRLDFVLGQVWRAMERIDHAVLFREGFVGLVRPGHPLLSCHRAELLERYLATPHVLFSEIGRVPRNVDTALVRIGRRRDVRISVSSLETAAEIVLRSDDLMNVGDRAAAVLATRHGLRPFGLPIDVPAFDVALSWPDQHRDTALTRWFGELASDCATADRASG